MRRAVVLFDGGKCPTSETIARLERAYDELVFVLVWIDTSYVVGKGWHPGNVLAETKEMISRYAQRPFYIFPFDCRQLKADQLIIRISHFSPRFDAIVTDDAELQTVAGVMGYKVENVECDAIETVADRSNVSRALYVTRAQPFHNGHREFLQHILENHDEAILSIACTEQALSLHNPATAGERMEIIGAYVLPNCNKRVWLVPFAHTPYMMEKIKNIAWFMPHFTHIYGSNPAHLLMGEMENLGTCLPEMKSSVRATQVRDTLAKGLPISGMVPEESEKMIYELGIDKRIKYLTENGF